MKTNRNDQHEFQAVDDYFRQHAEDIPVVFNAAHWENLASALDAVKQPDKPVSAKRSRLRIGKGWWISGLFLLLMATVWWSWPNGTMALQKTPEEKQGLPGVSTTMKEETAPFYPENYSGKTPASTMSSYPSGHTPVPAAQANEHTVSPEAVSVPSAAATEQSRPADSTTLRQNMPEQPRDSLSAPPKPVKKKKHLFW